MFEKTQRAAAGQQENAPVVPDEPVLIPYKATRMIWSRLFRHIEPRKQPQFVVLFQRGKQLAIAEPNGSDLVDYDSIADANFRAAIIEPLLERVRDLYGDKAHMLITYNGSRLWVCDEQDAMQCLQLNEPPPDPDEIRIEVHPFISRSWDIASAFAKTRHERVKFLGLLVFICAAVLLAGFGLSWLFAVYQLGRATEEVIKTLQVVQPPTWISMLFAAMLSAIEIMGILYRPMRPYAIGVGLADFALHAWYGHKIGLNQGDAMQIVYLWTIGFSLLSVVPEVATIYFGGICFYLAPLAGIWFPRRAGSILSGIGRAWRKHDYDVRQVEQQNTYTIIDSYSDHNTPITRYQPK